MISRIFRRWSSRSLSRLTRLHLAHSVRRRLQLMRVSIGPILMPPWPCAPPGAAPVPIAPNCHASVSFEELRRVLNNGQTVVVTDTSGQRTKGKVADVSSAPPSVVMLVPQARTFPESAVAEIRAADSRAKRRADWQQRRAWVGGVGLPHRSERTGERGDLCRRHRAWRRDRHRRGRADQGQGALSIASTEAPRDDFTDRRERSARRVVVRPFLAVRHD